MSLPLYEQFTRDEIHRAINMYGASAVPYPNPVPWDGLLPADRERWCQKAREYSPGGVVPALEHVVPLNRGCGVTQQINPPELGQPLFSSLVERQEYERTRQRLPTDAAARKSVPLATGCLDYFPDALAAVAELSRIGNEQHNPGKPLHWDRSKSTDEADCLIRHFIDRGTIDTDGVRHSAKVAWRALALLQKEIENVKAPAVPPGV